MPKYQLETKSIKYYTVTIEADSIEDAEAELRDWIADDFEDYETFGVWEDGEWVEVED